MKTLVYFVLLIAFLESSKALGAFGWEVPGGAPGDSSLGGLNPSLRLQQVYGRESFLPTVDSGFLISMIYFRADENALPVDGSARFSDVEIRLSTTSRQPDGLSTLFTENIGADETTVFGRGALTLNWTRGQFTTGITFDHPFLYNPAAGNLLLEMRSYGSGNIPSLDAFDTFGDPVSTVSTGLGADRPTGGISTRGLATLFWVDIVPVPEPSTTALLVLGIIALGWNWRRATKSLTMRD